MKKFEIGKKYQCRSICDSECIFEIEIIGRTAKMVSYIYEGNQRKSKISEYDGSEMIVPDKYSMAPRFHA